MAKISRTATTDEILTSLGARLRQHRLQLNRSIADVARAAGINPKTVERAEGGNHPTLETVVRILRVLDQVESLDALLNAPVVSPLALAALGGRERQRAGTPRRRRPPTPPASK